MYKRHKIIIAIIIVCLFFLSLFLGIDYNDNFISNSVTFLSIIIGFSITSLSILFSANSVKELYNQVDNEKKTITQLHRLVNYYRNSIMFSVFTVGFMILLPLFNVPIWIKHFLLPVIVANIYIFILLFSLFKDLFLKENSKKVH